MRKPSILHGIVGIVVGLCVTLLLVGGAWADKVDDLIRQLKDPDNKVRLQAALALGRSNDKRAVGPLTDALSDPDKTVRAVAAAGLAKLVDSSVAPDVRNRAIAALRRVADNDPDSFVRQQAQKAHDALKALATPPGSGGGGGAAGIPAGKKFYVELGAFDSAESGMGDLAKKKVQTSINAHPQFFTGWPGGKTPNQADLQSSGLQGSFYLQGSVTFEKKPNGSTQILTCKVSMTIATFPDRSIRATVTPDKAKAELEITPAEEAEGKKACVEYLFDDLIKKRILPFMLVYKP